MLLFGYAAENRIYGLRGESFYPNKNTDNLYLYYKNAIAKILQEDSEKKVALLKILGISFANGSERQDINSQILNDAQNVMEYFKSNDNENRTTSVIGKNEKAYRNDNIIGPFLATFPIDENTYKSEDSNYINNSNILYYKDSKTGDWKKLAGVKLKYNDKELALGENAEITNDLSNKVFYIDLNNKINSEDIKFIKLENKHNVYIGRIVIGGSDYDEYSQTAAIIRGAQKEYTSSCEWEIPEPVYSVDVNKYISKINNNSISNRKDLTENEKKNNKLFADYGDEITYTIDIKNTGTNVINQITLEDICDIKGLNIKEVSGGNWSINETTNNDNKIKQTYLYNNAGGLKPNDTTTLYITFKYNIDNINNMEYEELNDIIGSSHTNVNTVNITTIDNKSIQELKTESKLKEESKITSSDQITLKGYKFGITKEIEKITDKDGNDIGSKDYAEIGDIINYKITVSNNGDKNENYGSIKNILIHDSYNPEQLQYIGYEFADSDNLQVALGMETSNKRVDGYYYKGEIEPGKSITLYIQMEVISTSKDSEKIKNTAYLQYAASLRGSAIEYISNPKESSAEFDLATYSAEFDKYVNLTETYNLGDSRKKLTNDQKNNSPVEVEKGNFIQYTLKMKNTSETTTLYNIVLKDTFDDGIEYAGILSANIIDRDNIKTNIINYIDKNGTVNETTNKKEVNFELKNGEFGNGELSPNCELELIIKAHITKDNMYLYNLENKLELTNVINRNEKKLTRRLNKESKDYVRLKDPDITGKVWDDEDRDGLMSSSEKGLSGVTVKLHEVTVDKNDKIKTDIVLEDKTTVTDENGDYTFKNVEKATNKDPQTGNYSTNSEYKKYYIEFEYDGARYQNTTYAGYDNLNSNESYNENYEIDSNATEFEKDRQELNSSLETIDHNRGMSGIEPSTDNTKDLSYTSENAEEGHSTDGKDHTHSSKLNDDNVKISAISFVKKASDGKLTDEIRYLWLLEYGETDYLNHINLGLIERKLDISVTKDLYEITTTINGEQITYDYNQNENVRGNSKFKFGDNTVELNNDKAAKSDDLTKFTGNYITGDENTSQTYGLRFYKSDYNYRYYMYNDEVVKKYKTVNSELNAEVTYRIKITNNDVNDRRGIYTIIRELAEHYSKEYKALGGETTIMLKDSNELLYEQKINNIEAWYYTGTNDEKVKNDLVLNTDPKYGAKVTDYNYNTLYISGLDNIKLEEGDSIDIFIKYIVDKSEHRSIKIQNKKNTITELNAYSTYNSANEAEGYVDMNSNPGSLNANELDDTTKYENDTYKTQLQLSVNTDQSTPEPEPDPNPTPDPDPTPDPEPDPNPTPDLNERTITGFVWDDARTEKVTEEGNTDPQYIGDGKYDRGKEKLPEAVANLRVDENKDKPIQGLTAEIVELVDIPLRDEAGNEIKDENGQTKIVTYEQRLKIGNAIQQTTTGSDGKYTLNSFIPGKYIVMFHYGNNESTNMLIFNGQDYKTTTYKAGYESNEENKYVTVDTGDGYDKIIKGLESENKSDARDDEIRRLEVISYSEIMNNKLTEILQQKGNIDNTALINNTNMNAETPEFLIRPEKLNDYQEKGYSELKHLTYEDMIKQHFNENEFKFILRNIDLGLQYRPETKIELKKFISEIEAITSDGKTLMDAKFDNVYDGDDENRTIIGTKLNPSSKGVDNLQYLGNIVDEDEKKITQKGFAYLNIDSELLQGLTMRITYVFSANNLSEIDRIGEKLNELRYKDDNNSVYKEYFDDNRYTASGTARNELYSTYYKVDDINIIRTNRKIAYSSESEGYYGKYLGSVYYTGKVQEGNDVIATLKFDKILDYIDTNLVFNSSENDGENHKWSTITDEKLFDDNLVIRDAFIGAKTDDESSGTSETMSEMFDVSDEFSLGKIQLTNNKGISYNTENQSNLVVSVDDKISENDENNKNKLLSRYLVPQISDNKNSFGTIYITASKRESSETDTNNMTYDNVAEVIQYTSLTGRITNYESTIGNVIMKNWDGSTVNLDEVGASLEPTSEHSSNIAEIDTFYTERVTLAPPTGITLTKYYMKLWSNQIKLITIGILATSIVIVAKKKIKFEKPKKFYK